MTTTMPTYDQIPNVGLYLEQVTKYINEYLEPIGCAPITGSMISNYVKKGLVPNPVKKQYERGHVALLLMVGVCKTVLSLEEIQLLLHQAKAESQPMYESFCSALTMAMEVRFEGASDLRPEGGLLFDVLTAVAHRLWLEERFHQLARV